jgi:hypothetical protein
LLLVAPSGKVLCRVRRRRDVCFWPHPGRAAQGCAFYELARQLMTQSDSLFPTIAALRKAYSITSSAVGSSVDGMLRSSSYTRGNVTIIDRRGLIRRSWECYGVSKKELIVCSEASQCAGPAPIEAISARRLEPVRGTNVALSRAPSSFCPERRGFR